MLARLKLFPGTVFVVAFLAGGNASAAPQARAPHVQLNTVHSGEPSPPAEGEAPAGNGQPGGTAPALPSNRAAPSAPKPSGGSAAAWGENFFGQLGTLYKGDWESSPIGVEGLSGIEELAAADTFTLARLNDGTVAAWGGNESGQLGDDRGRPNWREGAAHVVVAEEDPVTHEVLGALHGVTALAAANEHSMALLRNETVMAWGSDKYGQLGNGQQGFERVINVNERLPKLVPGLAGIKAIAAGGASDYALTSAGTIRAWGSNTTGQLGLGQPGPDHCHSGEVHFELCSEVPRPVMWRNPATGAEEELGNVAAVRAGPFAAYALLKNGHVVSWGDNHNGELGTGAETWRSIDFAPAEVRRADGQPLTGVVELLVGNDTVMARLGDGEVLGWGSAAQGVMAGTSAEDCRRELTPPRQREQELRGEPRPCLRVATTIEALQRLHPQALALGRDFGLALSAGAVFAWGTDELGQLGSGNTPSGRLHSTPSQGNPGDPLPTRVPGLGTAIGVAAAGTHAEALLAGGVAAPAPLITITPEALAVNISWRSQGSAGQRIVAERLLYRVSGSEGEQEPAEQGRSEAEEGAPFSLESDPPHVTLGGEALEGTVPVPGEQLGGEPGTWSGARPITFSYQWQRCNAQGEACTNVLGAKRPRYTVAAADVGSALRVVVTATGPEPPPASVPSAATMPVRTGEAGEPAKALATSIHLSGLSNSFDINHVVEGSFPGGSARSRNSAQPLQPVPYEVRLRASGQARVMTLTPLAAG